MNNPNWALHVLVDAKTEYTKQLLDLLTPHIYEGIASLYGDAKQICHKHKNPQVLITFQKFLRNIPKWKVDILRNEHARILESSRCDFFDDLITAVFVSHTKVLTAIKIHSGMPKRPLDLKVPSGLQFIHKCYIQVAREFWKNPYLMDDTISSCDVQRNMRDGYRMIDNAIEETIRKELPVRHILQEYLGDGVAEDGDEEDDVGSVLSKSQIQNLRRMVSHDIANNPLSGAAGLRPRTPDRVDTELRPRTPDRVDTELRPPTPDRVDLAFLPNSLDDLDRLDRVDADFRPSSPGRLDRVDAEFRPSSPNCSESDVILGVRVEGPGVIEAIEAVEGPGIIQAIEAAKGAIVTEENNTGFPNSTRGSPSPPIDLELRRRSESPPRVPQNMPPWVLQDQMNLSCTSSDSEEEDLPPLQSRRASTIKTVNITRGPQSIAPSMGLIRKAASQSTKKLDYVLYD